LISERDSAFNGALAKLSLLLETSTQQARIPQDIPNSVEPDLYGDSPRWPARLECKQHTIAMRPAYTRRHLPACTQMQDRRRRSRRLRKKREHAFEPHTNHCKNVKIAAQFRVTFLSRIQRFKHMRRRFVSRTQRSGRQATLNQSPPRYVLGLSTGYCGPATCIRGARVRPSDGAFARRPAGERALSGSPFSLAPASGAIERTIRHSLTRPEWPDSMADAYIFWNEWRLLVLRF
jgi:hypothetical protein